MGGSLTLVALRWLQLPWQGYELRGKVPESVGAGFDRATRVFGVRSWLT